MASERTLSIIKPDAVAKKCCWPNFGPFRNSWTAHRCVQNDAPEP